MRDKGARDNETREIIQKIKTMPNLKEENLRPEEYAVPNGWANKIARDSKELKTAQLRKFFNEIKRLHQQTKSKRDINDTRRELIKLIPELIFAKGRRVITDDFYNLLEACILKKDASGEMVCRFKEYEEFENFVSLLEAIVAYHKAEHKGGQNERL
jgi:CRISPR-associated protein Csm2